MPFTDTIPARLAARVRSAGSAPLLTYYDTRTGERVELSAISFANWVDKTSNLLSTLGVEDGFVAGPVSVEHPGHWVSLIWPLAAWQHGCGYAAVERSQAVDADVAVIGPEAVAPVVPGATIACSLHALALPFSVLPVGVLDYTREVLGEPDAHWAASVDAGRMAWVDRDRELTHAALAGLPPVPDRVLVRPTTAWDTLSAALLRPLLGGGSAVVVSGDITPDALARLAESERVTAGVS